VLCFIDVHIEIDLYGKFGVCGHFDIRTFWSLVSSVLSNLVDRASIGLHMFIHHEGSKERESLANAKVNVRQHCVSLSCLCNSLTQRAKDMKIGILDDRFLVWCPISPEPLRISA